jgi:hypothetical protein
LNRIQVLPLTTGIELICPSEALVTINGEPHKAMADQIRTVVKEWLGYRVGTLTPRELIAQYREIDLTLQPFYRGREAFDSV